MAYFVLVSEVKAKPKVQNKGAEKTQSKIPTNGANVEKFVNDVFDIMSPLFLSEVIRLCMMTLMNNVHSFC